MKLDWTIREVISGTDFYKITIYRMFGKWQVDITKRTTGRLIKDFSEVPNLATAKSLCENWLENELKGGARDE